MARQFNYANISSNFDDCQKALDSAIVNLARLQPAIVSTREIFVVCGRNVHAPTKKKAERLINEMFQSTTMILSRATLIQRDLARAERCAKAAMDDFRRQSA